MVICEVCKKRRDDVEMNEDLGMYVCNPCEDAMMAEMLNGE